MRPLKPSAADGAATSGGSVAWTRRQEPGERADFAVESEKRLGVSRPPCLQLRRRPSRVAPQREGRPVDGRGEGDHVGLDCSKAVRAELEVPDDARTKTSDAVGDNRRPHTRSNLLGRQCAARAAAAFENECAEPRFRQVSRRHQAVVAGTHDDRVVSLASHESQAALRFGSERTTWRAARRPDAPMIPPPGCVAEPHIQRFRSGV